MNIINLRCYARIAACLLLFCEISKAEEAGVERGDPFSVAVLHGTFSNQYGKNLHNDEFDEVLQKLGWGYVKYNSENEDMSRLAEEIGRYEMAMVNPLFNFGGDRARLPAELAPALRNFIINGGAIVITDAVYQSQTDWLEGVDPSLKISVESCDSPIDSFYVEPLSAFNCMPNILRIGRTFSHLKIEDDSKWEVVARCGQHGAPSVIAARQGKGFVYATTFRHPNAQLLENMRANLELQRMNIVVSEFKIPKLSVGKGRIELKVRNLSDTPSDIALAFKAAGKNGASSSAKRRKPVAAGGEKKLSIDYDIPLRGKADVVLSAASGGKSAALFSREVEFPPLLSISPPVYRGMALESELAKTGQITVSADITPYREKLDELVLNVYAVGRDGTGTGRPLSVKPGGGNAVLRLDVGKLPKGEYAVHAELSDANGALECKTADFRVVDESECPVFVNDDMNFIVNGAPFFPVGMYHMSPDEFGELASIGINTVQLWSWCGPESVDAAAKHGLSVIWEQAHRKSVQVIRDNVPALKGKPNLLFWYGMDEPYEGDFQSAKEQTETFHESDAGHPVFMVSCRPEFFESHATLGDVFAVDPYPYPKNSLTMVSDWMDLAKQVSKGLKPVVAVLQSFGHEPEPEFRVMTYLALTHGARGVIWYPWNDGGSIGMKYNPDLQEACKKLCAEMKMLAPALMNAAGRREFLLEDGKIHGIYCAAPDGKRFILLVNPDDSVVSAGLGAIPELAGVSEIRNAFGGDPVRADAPFEMNPLSTAVFAW